MSLKLKENLANCSPSPFGEGRGEASSGVVFRLVMVYAFGCVMMLSFSLSSIIIPIFLSTFAG